MGLNWIDYAVVFAYVVAITIFGSRFARFQRTTGDYFLSGRTVPWWAICFTVVATETSTLTFIGVPAAAYAGNMTFLQLAAGYVLGRVIVSVLFLPAYFRGELVTSYQLLQQRFGTAVKTVAAGLFLVTRSLADGIRLFATALVISIVAGVPVSITIVVLGAAMIWYTMRGGVAAVIWTDVVQMFVYVTGALIVLVAVWQKIPGGMDDVIRVGSAAGRFTVLDWSADPRRVYTIWSGLIGGIALTLATHGTDQFLVQRLLSARSPREASRGLILSGVLVFAQFVLFLTIGIILFVHNEQTHFAAGILRPDEILPRFIGSALPHGAIGFIVAAIVAAALSPSLNAMAATTINDFYRPYMGDATTDATLLRLSRGATVAWGVVQVGVALAAQSMRQSVLDAGLSVLSLTTGPVLGAFVVGVLTRRVGSVAVLAGMFVGAAVVCTAWWTGALAWTWYTFVGAAVTSAVSVVVGALVPRLRRATGGAVERHERLIP
jgi:solute:Na+ symporter, SSS family